MSDENEKHPVDDVKRPVTPTEARRVKSIDVARLHGHLNVKHNFDERINVVYGQNGAGKTTLLHILANALAGEYERFVFLQFEKIFIDFYDGRNLELKRKSRDKKKVQVDVTEHTSATSGKMHSFVGTFGNVDRSRVPDRVLQPLMAVSYFPAFRSLLDALEDEGERIFRTFRRARRPTEPLRVLRELFGQFVPRLSYPSLRKIDDELRKEATQASQRVAEDEALHMTTAAIVVFRQIFKDKPRSSQRSIAQLRSSIAEARARIIAASDVLNRNTNLKELTDSELENAATPAAARSKLTKPILSIFNTMLKATADFNEDTVRELDKYLKAVNLFLSQCGKSLVVREVEDGGGREVRIQHEKADAPLPLHALSSGERQIVAMLYKATHLRDTDLVLIDEPELSLHVGWQRPLVGRLDELIGDKQIIVATHSPVIGADVDVLQHLDVTYASSPLEPEEFLSDHSHAHIREITKVEGPGA